METENFTLDFYLFIKNVLRISKITQVHKKQTHAQKIVAKNMPDWLIKLFSCVGISRTPTNYDEEKDYTKVVCHCPECGTSDTAKLVYQKSGSSSSKNSDSKRTHQSGSIKLEPNFNEAKKNDRYRFLRYSKVAKCTGCNKKFYKEKVDGWVILDVDNNRWYQVTGARAEEEAKNPVLENPLLRDSFKHLRKSKDKFDKIKGKLLDQPNETSAAKTE